MPRTPDEVYAEIAAWPLADQLRLAARIVEVAARRAQVSGTGHPPVEPAPPQPAGRPAAAIGARPAGARAAIPVSATPSPRPAAPAEVRGLVIVDGSNFLGTVSGFELASEASREELVTRLQDFAHDHPSLRIVVYFDGQKTTVKRSGGVEVRFTPREKPADFFIVEMLRALGDPERRRALLVTADRALADAARKLGAKVEAPASFYRRLPGVRRTAVGERGLSAAEVADWESYFQRPPDQGRKPGKK